MAIQRPNDDKNTQNQSALGAAFKEAGISASPQPQVAQPAAPSFTAPSAAPAAAGGSTSNQKNFMDIDSQYSLISPISKNAVGESTDAFATAFQKRLEAATANSPAKDSFKVVVMPNNQGGNHFSSILFLRAFTVKGVATLAVYNLLVESSAPRLPSRNFNIAGQPISVPTVASDAIDQDLWNRVVSFLQGTWGKDAVIYDAGQRVLPTELSPEDANAINNLTYYATQALGIELARRGVLQAPPIDVKLLAGGGRTVVGMDPAPPALHDAAGAPIRSDLSIVLRKESDMGQNAWSPNATTQRDLTRLDGYVDLDFHMPQPNPQQQMYGGMYGQPQPQTQRYLPRLVITRMESAAIASTPELDLLALSTAMHLGLNNQWMQLFQPRWNKTGKKGEVDLRDVSALGFETQLTPDAAPGRLPLPGASDMPKFYQMLALAIHPNLMYSMDVEEAGDLTWLHSDLYRAALGDQEATRNIITAADRLTDGIFSQGWDGSAVAIDEDNRIALGYWTDSKGQLRDIRDLDYLAMLNLVGEKDITILHDWSDTFYNRNVPLEIRLERRDRIQREILGGYTLKGYARRIVLTQKFLVHLAQSIERAGLVAQSSAPMVDMTGQTIRGNYYTANQAFNVNNAGIGMFSGGPTGYGNYRGLGAAPMGGFGR